MKSLSFIINREEEDLRIDQLLKKKFPHYSRSYFQYLIKEGHVTINEKRGLKRQKTRIQDRITLFFAPSPAISLLSSQLLTPENISLNVLYEDDDLIVVNKQSGMVVHPAPGNISGTFVHALLHHCSSLSIDSSSLRPGIVHRLDKETTGALVAAKRRTVQEALSRAFCERKVRKEYLAVTCGCPREKVLSAPIGRSPRERKKMAVIREGKYAETEFSIVAQQGELGLIRVKPTTGRTHQIRVHLQHMHTPLIGDRLYGTRSINQKYHAERQLLHAWKLCFFHPVHQEKICITAPLSEDMQQFINQHFSIEL